MLKLWMITFFSCAVLLAVSGSDLLLNRWRAIGSAGNPPEWQTQNRDGRRVVNLTVENGNNDVHFYTHAKVKEGARYALTIRFTVEKLIPGSVSESGGFIHFRGMDGKILKQGSEHWDIALKEGKTIVVRKEFTACSPHLQLVGLFLKKTGGIFQFSECDLREIPDTAVVPEATPAVSAINPLDPAWKKASALERFYKIGKDQTADVETYGKMCYDSRNLYILFDCKEPKMEHLKKEEKQRDGKVWTDDNVEVWLAPENGRKIQVVMNAAGAIYDAELYQIAAGDPWKTKEEWNGSAIGRVKLEKDRWLGMIVIPWSDLNFSPVNGNKLGVNLVRGRYAGDKEYTHWHRIDGKHSDLEKFGQLEFGKNGALFHRFSEKFQNDPFAVNRTNANFDAAPRLEDQRYQLCGLTKTFTLSQYPKEYQKANKLKWAAIQDTMLEQMDPLGLQFPLILPWADKWAGGKRRLDALLAKHPSMKMTIAMHNSSHDAAAIASKNASYFHGRYTNLVDPATGENLRKWFRDYIQANPEYKSRLFCVRGFDEPTNSLAASFSKAKNPGNEKNLSALDARIKEEFGFGKYGLFDAFGDNSDADAPFRRITFHRWWNHEILKSIQKNTKVVREILPDVPYMPIVSNTVTTYSGSEMVPLFSKYGDWHGIDPYPTATYSTYGGNRALYAVGFNTKLHRDFISPDKKLFIYIQGFTYRGRTPSADNLTEWSSQALKNGVNIISWYDVTLTDTSYLYPEVLRLSKIIHDMKPLKLPETSKTAVYFSYPTAWGNFDATQHPHYALYSILGEHLKYWFRFIHDAEANNLSDYRLILVPRYTYFFPERAAELIDYVKKGGNVLIFDPEIFTADIKGQSGAALRRELLGFDALKPVAAKSIKMNGKSYPLSPSVNVLHSGIRAFTFALPQDGKVIAEYPDGAPAAMERPLGKGKVIYFAAQPFGNSDFAVAPGNWKDYLDGVMKEAGEKKYPDLWNFSLPFNNSK